MYPYFSVMHPWAMGTVTVSGEAHGNGPGIALGGNGGMRWLEPGMFVVADTNNHRIHAFGPNGSYAFEFGSYGDDPGEFDSPTDMAIGPDGRIAVADTNNHRIHVFHPDGSYAFAFGSYGAGPKQFISPVDVTICPDGRIAVADPGRINVQVFHPNTSFAFSIDTIGGPRHADPEKRAVAAARIGAWSAARRDKKGRRAVAAARTRTRTESHNAVPCAGGRPR